MNKDVEMAGEHISIKVLIIDDEEEVRELLAILLQSHPDITVLGAAPDVDKAVRMTHSLNPDLVLLDIQMPGRDGFDYIDAIRSDASIPGIIFVTAFENYAIRAIRNAAFDYLLKPVNKAELFHAIDRYREMIARNRKADIARLIELYSRSKPGRLRLNTRTGYFFVDPEEIVYCEADGNYSHIWLATGRKETSTLNLGSIMKSLEGDSFLRISRSYIINMQYISRVDRKVNSCELEVDGTSYTLKIPAQNIKILEEYFN